MDTSSLRVQEQQESGYTTIIGYASTSRYIYLKYLKWGHHPSSLSEKIFIYSFIHSFIHLPLELNYSSTRGECASAHERWNDAAALPRSVHTLHWTIARSIRTGDGHL